MYHNQEYKNQFRILKGGLISLVVASNLYGAPTGGTVVSGTATISQNANTTNINQSSNKAIINWQDFSIKSNETVNFNQPNVNSITLNRVIGNEKSIIDGALNANGQVWLVNSNGVLFGKNAKVNTAGIVASTKDISNEDFNNGNYNFKGNSNESIVNEGEIKSLANTHATFIANSVTNKGIIEVHKGTINLVGASDVTLTLNENQNISLKVNKGVLDALVDNQNLIVANGGQIYLTTNAKNELLKGVVNNSGIIEVNSLDELTQSEVILFAHGGTANIDGTINAKGGFVETSGKNLNVTNNSKIQAKKWLIDPVNVTIDNSNGTVGSEKVGASVIQTTLNGGTDVTIQADNDINVNETISYNQNKLTLNAGNNININKDINVTGGGLYLVYAQASGNTTGDYKVNAKVNLENGTTFKTKKGTDGEINWTVVTANDFYTTLNANKSGNYVLGKDITLNGTNNWTAIGDSSNNFTGKFDGLGHTISSLNINQSGAYFQGLFGFTSGATIKNIGLENVYIKGNDYVGGLVGGNFNSTISNSYATGTVIGTGNYVGGLVGGNFNSTISNSYATGTVIGTGNHVGGLVGINNNISTISNSYATGTVIGNIYVGGLVGDNFNSTISNSFYDNEENTATMNDSSIGRTKAQILTAFNGKTGWITRGADVAGYSTDTILLPQLKTFYKPTNTLFQSGYGTSTNPYTITNWTQLQNINNTNILTQNYYFNLLNNLSSSTSDYTSLASNTANSGAGWNPIGNLSNKFNGTFDGLGFTISNLYINRSSQFGVGLFGYTYNATIKNIGLKDLDIRGDAYVGGLVGFNENGTISNSYTSGTVSGTDYVGGLVGNNHGTTTNSYASGTVSGTYFVGGLVGYNYGTTTNSYSSGTVNGTNYVGGLVGYNAGTITNSYSSATVNGSIYVGGLVGYNAGTISNSFYDITKNPNHNNGLGVGKTTQEMSYGTTFKNASWDIVSDNSVTFLTPVIKWDSVNNKYVWAISPIALTYTLSDKTTTYDGTTQTLSSFYTSNPFTIPTGYEFLNLTSADYKFQVDGADVTGYKDAGTYSNIKIASNSDFLTIANSGNTDGKLTINKKDLTISNIGANNKVYDGTTTATLSNIGTLVGLVTGENLVLNNPTSVIFSSKDVGDNINVTATGYTIADKDSFKASNYNLLDTSKTTTANISKASLTATLNDNSKTYDGTSYSEGNGITFNGFVNGETASLLGGNLVYSGTSQGAKDAGNYIISGNGLTSNNYNISFVDGKLTINKKDLTISNIGANNKVYDGTTTATLSNSGTLDGLVTGENLVLNNPTSVIFSSKDVGDNINVTATGYTIADKDSFKASNYNLLDTSKTTTANIVASVNPTPNPTPTPTPKVDEKVQRVVASIEPSTNSNSSSNQSVPNSLNINIRTLSFNGVDETRVINSGVKMPENIANEEDIIK